MTRILITGCNGFVGTNLYRAFSGDFALSGVDLPGDGPYPAERVFSWEDLAAGRLPPVDAVIHLAGKAHDTRNTADPESYFRINLGLTQTAFDGFLQSEATHFILFSSVKAVADTVDGDVLTEDAEPDPQTPYGQSKLAAERYVSEASHDKRVTILRPCMIHGPGNKGNLNELYSIVSKGIPWPLGAFDNRRTLLSVDNLIYVLRQLIERDIAPGTYQVADDEAVSTNELVRLIAETAGKRPRIWNLPPGCVRALARAGDHLHLPLNSERLKKLTESYVASNAKLKEALGIEHLPVRAADGLRQTLASFSH
jgi:nucleoside-diphosphate-sugar epimerase